MNSDQNQTLESSIPRRGRPPRKNPPQKSKSSLGLSLSGVRKPRPRAVKLVLPSVQAAVPNLAKIASKSSEIVKTFPIASAKDSPPITTFLLAATNGKTGPMTKSGSLPMNLVQHVTSADPTSIKQFPVAVSSNILPRVQASTSTASSPKLLLITTASNSAVSVPTTSGHQTLCKTLLPVKLSNNTSNPSSMVAGNLGKQVLYQIPSQGSGMVLLSTTVPLQSGVAPKKYLLIPNSTTTKRQSNAAVILNSKISNSVVDLNSDQPVTTIITPIQTTSPNSPSIDFSQIPTTIVPITSNLAETTSKKLTRQSAINSNSPTKRVNTSRRRGSVHGANSTISSIPSGTFKTVACTTNSRGICSTPVSIQISPKPSNVKLTQVGGLAPFNPLINPPMQQMSVFTQDASLNMTLPTVPETSLKTNNLFTQSSNNKWCSSSITSVNACTFSKTLSDSKQPSAATESRKQSKRSRPLPGHRAKKTISKIDQNEGSTSSFITVPSSLPFSAIQLKTNCSTAPASSFSGLSWVVSPNTAHQQQKTSLNTENGTKDQNMPAKYKTMPKLIVVNGLSNSNFSTTPSANSQTSNNGCQVGIFSATQYPECSKNTRPIYASPPKLTIAPGFSTTDKTGSNSDKKKRPSELMIIKEREEFIDDSMEKSNLEDLSPPKLQREDGTDLSGSFIFEMPSPIQSSSPSYLSLAKSTSTAQAKSISELPSALSMTNQYQTFCHEIKPTIRKDNFPTLANLSAILNSKCSEFISRLDKNRKLSFGQLFNHFKVLADKKNNKKASSHSAIMFQVAHSIHCCVVLAAIDVEGSVDLKDLPFCVEKSMKCSVKCRQTFMKDVFAEKSISSLLDPRFGLSILKSSDSTNDERSTECHPSNSTTNLSSANVPFSSNLTPDLSKIKIELPESDKYPPDDQQENLTNSAFIKKSTANLTSEASSQKFATDIDESFSSYSSITPHSDSKCLMQCSQNPCEKCLTPASTNQPIHSCTNSRTRAQNRGKSLSNGKCKKTHSSKRSSQHKIKNVCNNANESSAILKVSSHSSNSQVLAGKLRYKIVPKGHISLSGTSPEKESNCMESLKGKSKFPVQSYIINGDKSSIKPIQTISPMLAPSQEVHKDETKNLTDSNFHRKQKRRLPSPLKPCGENTPRKKICKSKMTAIPSTGKSPTKASKEGCSKSSPPAKISFLFVEKPLPVRDPKHLYDEPTTADRVVMLTPDGKPILTGTDLQMTFHDSLSCLSSPKKRRKSSKGESPIKSSLTKAPSSSCSIFKKSSSAKDKVKVQGRHSKSLSTNNQFSHPPKLNFLLRELEHKCKYKYLSSSPPMTNSIKTNDSLFHKTYLDREKSKKANIEQIINNISSGFPAFGPGRPRCTMKLYKYFVSTRIKNRAKKNGSHEIDAPLILYINWKTLSRQPFNKHRITNHTLNIMAIKNAKQFANFKKCKSRSKMCKPVKNKPLFMKRRRALLALHNRKIKRNADKSKKQTDKKHSKCLQQSRSSKTKTQNTKTSSSKKKALVPKLEGTMMIKTEKTNSTELAAIAEREKSKSLINKNDARKNKTLKSAEKKLKVSQFKRSKQVNKKRATKKCSSVPVLKTTRSKNALPETQHADSEKVRSFCEASNRIETKSENRVMKKAVKRTIKVNRPEILNEETKSNKSDSHHRLNNLEDEDLPSRIKSADLMMEQEKPADIKPDITKSQTDLQENNSITEMVTSPISSNSTIVKTRDSHQGTQQHQKKFASSMKRPHSKTVVEQFTNAPEEPFSEKEDANIDNSDQTLPLEFANNPVEDHAEVATHEQLPSPTIIEDSGNFIFEDYVEPSLPVMDNAPMLCYKDKQLNSMPSSVSVDNNQPDISNTCTSFINVTPTSRSSAFSDKFDIGLSPELARIQKLKDQLQEKQKALDLAKLYLK